MKKLLLTLALGITGISYGQTDLEYLKKELTKLKEYKVWDSTHYLVKYQSEYDTLIKQMAKLSLMQARYQMKTNTKSEFIFQEMNDVNFQIRSVNTNLKAYKELDEEYNQKIKEVELLLNLTK